MAIVTEPASIEPDVLYRLDELQRRCGLAKHGMRMARRAGLKVSYLHRRCFVLGRDWIDYVQSHGAAERPLPPANI